MGLRMSRHAWDVATRRGIAWEDLVRTVTRPRFTTTNTRGQTVYHGDLLAVVVGNPRFPGGDSSVVTILLRTTERWDDETARRAIRGERVPGSVPVFSDPKALPGNSKGRRK